MVRKISSICLSLSSRPFQKWLLGLLCIFSLSVAAQPQGVLLQSKPDLFTYYDPARLGNPPSADLVSKSIMQFDSYNSLSNNFGGASGTAFLIKTLRGDNKICMCLTGHQITDLISGADILVKGTAIHFNSDIYMNYLGADTVVNGEHMNLPTQFSKSFLGAVTILDYYHDRSIGKDAALVLIDKRQLPSALFSTLGYDFDDGDWSLGQYYTISHPYNFPQRMIDSLNYTDDFDYAVVLNTKLPYAAGLGSSGSPLVTRPATNTQQGVVRGILAIGENESTFEASRKVRPTEFLTLNYSTSARFTKINVLESSIRRYCWKKSDSANISLNGSYKQTVTIDNSSAVGRYSWNYEVKSSGNLTDAAVFTEVASDVEITRLNANSCTISSFTLPVVFADNGKPWQVAVAAKQIDVGADFNYAASGVSELELSTVVIGEALSSATRQTDNAASVQNIDRDRNGFNVYPNPSPDGTFNISLPAAGQYRLEIHSVDGKKIYAAGCTGNPFQFALSAASHGNYFLTVFNKERNELVYGKMIVY